MTSEQHDHAPLPSSRQKPVLSKYEIIGLIAIVAIAVWLAIPAMKRTYTGAVLSGECEGNAQPQACSRPTSQGESTTRRQHVPSEGQ
jgi:hypothetical protein